MRKNHFSIVFENDSFVAINKPAGMLTIPDREQKEKSLKEYLLDTYGTIFTVHRLDRETSGLILFAKNESAHRYFSKMFEERKIEKYYVGIVMGCPSNTTGIIDAPITEHLTNKGTMVVHRSGKPSSTSYRVIESHHAYSLVSFQLHTGRTHQIRLHAQHIGHPLACDSLYGDGKPVLLSSIKKKFKLSKHDEAERPMIDRVALHSHQLVFQDEFMHPFDIMADIPKEFTALMNQLRKNK